MTAFPATAAALALGGPAAAVVGLLTDLKIRQEDIEQIAKMLTANQETVTEAAPGGIGATAFGESSSGALLAHHTAIAHEHVREAMFEMADGLLGYREVVRDVAKTFFELDDQVQERMTTITSATQSVSGTNFTDSDGGSQ